jgi:hypothetical protein
LRFLVVAIPNFIYSSEICKDAVIEPGCRGLHSGGAAGVIHAIGSSNECDTKTLLVRERLASQFIHLTICLARGSVNRREYSTVGMMVDCTTHHRLAPEFRPQFHALIERGHAALALRTTTTIFFMIFDINSFSKK